ncbi:MAG: hypothetical protein ACJA04_000815 [Cellvibrionaceae bacterium]
MKKIFLWSFWSLISLGIAGYYINMMWFGEDETPLLIGETTSGHHQIEMACESCHTTPFGGPEVLQDACMNCHAEELKMVDDTHPESKFADPRNFDLLEVINARHCITCHTEHQKEKTLKMGVTLPIDQCFHCHKDIGKERESHKDMAFDTCGSAGCHNFHDNRALYEGFLLRHANEPVLKEIAAIPARTAEAKYREENPQARALTAADIDLTYMTNYEGSLSADVVHGWVGSSHARNGVQCVDCHTENNAPDEWIEKPDHKYCQSCHQPQVKGFLEGKHGMRLADAVSKPLEAIKPRESELPFKEKSLDIVHSCTSCHGSHSFNTRIAAVSACLGCHDDEHSLAFLESPHGILWQQEVSGTLPENTGVSCATCHMHREILDDKEGGVFVVHNQNLTLRPNEKMIRPVCMNCHGLAFSIDSLADERLIRNNFNGQPEKHIRSIDMVLERDKSD